MSKDGLSKNLLITTAIEATWREDMSVVFLGEWCCLYAREDVWSKLDSVVMDEYGWGEKQQEQEFDLVHELYEELLIDVSNYLNEYHRENKSVRYWRIIVGQWLFRYTSIVFNRWHTITSAIEKYEISETVIIDYPVEKMIANDSLGFLHLVFGDEWNHRLYAKILQSSSNVTCDYRSMDSLPIDMLFNKKRAKLSVINIVYRYIKKAISPLIGLLTKNNSVFIISSSLPKIQETKLFWKLRQFSNLQWGPDITYPPPDMRKRTMVSLQADSNNGLKMFLYDNLFDFIPVCYLEGYNHLVELSKVAPWPKKPKTIFTTNSFDTDELFKVWAAHQIENGSKYIIGQHGGFYGTNKYTDSEMHENKTSDKYLTWGWSEFANQIPCMAFSVIGKLHGDWDRNGGLLLVQLHRDIRVLPWDGTKCFKEYLERQFTLCDLLPKNIRNQLIVRLHAAYINLGWEEDIMWKQRFPSIHVDNGKKSIDELVSSSRLTIHTYTSTGILENLSRNIPTLCFWDQKRWPLRESALRAHDKLMKAGILHHSPESVANKVIEIWDGVEDWWNDSLVQESRVEFCEHYARIPDNPINNLKDELVK